MSKIERKRRQTLPRVSLLNLGLILETKETDTQMSCMQKLGGFSMCLPYLQPWPLFNDDVNDFMQSSCRQDMKPSCLIPFLLPFCQSPNDSPVYQECIEVHVIRILDITCIK